jgi:hypothetical protein
MAQGPEATIDNGLIQAKIPLPDSEKGYYRGTRFDWSGQISSLKVNGHEYFGNWFEGRYDPKNHDTIMGPVEEFSTDGGLGYADNRDTFVRIGVGSLKRIKDEPRYQRFKTYEIVDHGKWTVKPGKDQVTFVHELKDPSGIAYRYEKVVRLAKGKPELIIEHSLKNTGSQPIRTDHYNHNFFVIDGQPTGPDSSIRFPFELKATRGFQGDLAEVRGGDVVYKQELAKGQSVYGEFEGSQTYDVRIENKKAGAGVRITGDKPMAKIVYWSIRTTTCPEPYIEVVAEPGKTFKWAYKYEFYNLDAAKTASR